MQTIFLFPFIVCLTSSNITRNDKESISYSKKNFKKYIYLYISISVALIKENHSNNLTPIDCPLPHLFVSIAYSILNAHTFQEEY